MNGALEIIGKLKKKKVDLGRTFKLNKFLCLKKIIEKVPISSSIHILSSISAENYFSQDIKSIENELKIMQETYANIEHGSADTDPNLYSLELKDENIEQYLKLISFFGSQESPFCLDKDFLSKIERTNGKKEGLLGAELSQIEQNINIRIRHSW